MPATHFKCPTKDRLIKIEGCLNECPDGQRCATLAYLRMVAYDREWRGITPSMAGNGPRLIYLKRVKPYSINPYDRAFAALGVGVHGKLGLHAYIDNILSEEPLSDEQTKGTPDCLEPDEQTDDCYVLTDYKTWGSYKVKRALGIVEKQEPVLDENGKPVLLKSGKNQGKPKTKTVFAIDEKAAETNLLETSYQLNRYRILFELAGFPISHLQVQTIVRDGNTYIAKSRGVDAAVYLITIPFLGNFRVLAYYKQLKREVEQAMITGTVRKCNDWESWERRRCKGYCEVVDYCKEMEGGMTT